MGSLASNGHVGLKRHHDDKVLHGTSTAYIPMTLITLSHGIDDAAVSYSPKTNMETHIVPF